MCASCSRARSRTRTIHFLGVLGFLGYLSPWAMREWSTSKLPMAGIGVCLMVLTTRASFWDVVGALVKGAKDIMPLGKK